MANLIPAQRVTCPRLNLSCSPTSIKVYSSALAHFSSIPWTSALLRGAIPFLPACVNPLSDDRDQFLTATLSSPRALKHVLSFFRHDHNVDNDDDNDDIGNAALLRDPERPITRVSSLFALGDGLVGYVGIVHGGMVMTMVDEAMGALLDINTACGKSGRAFANPSLTAGFDIKFLHPVRLGEVVVHASIQAMDRRKTQIRCEVRDKDGLVLATCLGTWISLKSNL